MSLKTNIFRAALFTPMRKGRWGLPLMAWSLPGEAKSAILSGIGDAYVDLPVVILSPGEMGEGAFGVIPVPDRSGVIKYPPPEWTQVVARGGVVFIDEMTSVPQTIAPAVNGILLDARVGGHVLDVRVRRIGAANPPEYAANGCCDLNPAQANRVGHVQWSAPSVEEHESYLLRGDTAHRGSEVVAVSAAAEEARVLAAWEDGAWARAVGLETSFLRARPDLKNVCPKATDPAASRAWPSDRSWENATRALASAHCHGLSEADTDEFVSAFIGLPSYAQWKTFIKAADLPDAAALLDGRIKFEFDARRVDRTYATFTACVALVAPAETPNRVDRAVTFWRILRRLFESGVNQDLVVGPAQRLLALKLGANSRDPKLCAAYAELGRQEKFVELLKLAGLGVR